MDESMLASHWALWMSTGSDEMSVFQMLSAGNIGHPAAPGTGVPALAGPASTAPVVENTVVAARRRTPHDAQRVRGTTWRDDIPRMLGSSASGHPALTPDAESWAPVAARMSRPRPPSTGEAVGPVHRVAPGH